MRGAPALILSYHRVAHREADPHALCVRPERFAAQLDELSRIARIVPLALVTRPSRRPQVALTFDDGYRDNLTTAYPLLNSASAPATFFITTGMLDRRQEFWWDRLERLLIAEEVPAVRLELELGGHRLWFDARTPADRERAHHALHHRLLGFDNATIARVLDQLAERFGSRPEPRQENLPLTSGELRLLAAADGVEIGAHSVTHPRLADLTPGRQRAEIATSKQTLEACVDAPVRSFAYPFGGPDAVDDVAPRLVAAEGLDWACTTLEGRVTSDSDPFRLPRCTVRDWDGPEFGRRVQRWLGL